MTQPYRLLERVQDYIDLQVELHPHRQTILFNWPEGSDHYDWVLAAPISVVKAWALAIELDAEEDAYSIGCGE